MFTNSCMSVTGQTEYLVFKWEISYIEISYHFDSNGTNQIKAYYLAYRDNYKTIIYNTTLLLSKAF